MAVLIPEWVAARHQAQHVDRQLHLAKEMTRRLRDLDPRLECVWADDRHPAGLGIVPGRWHVRRRNDPPAPDTYIPICRPDGSYREPAQDVLDELSRRDLHRPGALEARRDRRERERRAAAADRRREKEARVADLAQNIKALDSPSVLVNTDIPHRATARGRRSR